MPGIRAMRQSTTWFPRYVISLSSGWLHPALGLTGPLPLQVVSLSDDPTLVGLTFRAMVVGTCLVALGSSVSQLMFFKTNPASLSSFFMLAVSYPLLYAMAKYLPAWNISLFGYGFCLNPGPFSKKEHLLLMILVSSGSSAAYAGEIIGVQSLFYHSELGTIPGLLLLITTQQLGYALAGLSQSILVRPRAMVWPSTLVFVSIIILRPQSVVVLMPPVPQVTLFETLHSSGTDPSVAQTRRDRMRFFSYCFIAIFLYQFAPGYWFPGLSSLSILCIAGNRNS